ncbi:GlsB/YeaQ/YmgE family stress response membrane protein [Limosilactobacillus sp. RRLNB_1_1]|uniref:GlsB/YeaQ/YmgE family stress response membrane protein n=2 Tax=Limosilactobacillus TaxID=2742598 RepID=A0A7W3TR87_9LACO|nr:MULTISPECIES: GlsB/YeaQ/YmgE family stress response membrane protein [Limosilactobacillus]MBC8743462.1 GlsB/YeaQ/YmgE family stress response membrane protein [Lactobacillus sp. Marseille-P7033]MRH45236.1 GlsB/YeaQ/YmgE family stress response membrane protein [Limosilactobacillus reuteri]MBB1069425.1 GlsB/YeaQ/YmgE family stress response membrane protein [Limosilactobacillus albertensis]MBB1123008.1 GlsB/YeaQ/YmgE family stress response membrane protein [Limosilactobacillus albertensis]MCD71
MHWIWVIIVGGLIGLAAGALTRRGGSMGVISNIIAGLVGSVVGEAILGAWGPQVAGMAIIPSVIGAVILVMIVSLIFGIRTDH